MTTPVLAPTSPTDALQVLAESSPPELGESLAGLDTMERALVDVVRRLLGRPFEAALPSGHRLDKAAYHVLSRLEEFGDVRLSDLAAVAGLDVSTISRQVRQLEDAELVQRRADPDDKRATRIDLTDAGHTDLAAMRRERQLRLQGAVADWPEHDRDTLTTLLQRLADTLAPDCTKSLSKATTDRPTREVSA